MTTMSINIYIANSRHAGRSRYSNKTVAAMYVTGSVKTRHNRLNLSLRIEH